LAVSFLYDTLRELLRYLEEAGDTISVGAVNHELQTLEEEAEPSPPYTHPNLGTEPSAKIDPITETLVSDTEHAVNPPTAEGTPSVAEGDIQIPRTTEDQSHPPGLVANLVREPDSLPEPPVPAGLHLDSTRNSDDALVHPATPENETSLAQLEILTEQRPELPQASGSMGALWMDAGTEADSVGADDVSVDPDQVGFLSAGEGQTSPLSLPHPRTEASSRSPELPAFIFHLFVAILSLSLWRYLPIHQYWAFIVRIFPSVASSVVVGYPIFFLWRYIVRDFLQTRRTT
jgi:hypothetical protein